MYGIASDADMPLILNSLNKKNDNTEYTKMFFDKLCNKKNIYIIKENDNILCTIFGIDVTYNKHIGTCLYGIKKVCKSFDSKIIKGFLNFIESDLKTYDKEFVAIASDEETQKIFEECNYVPSFNMRTIKRNIKNNLWAQAEFDGITARNLESYRDRFIKKNYISLNTNQYATILFNHYSKGGSTISDNYGYGIYYEKDKILYFTELYSENDTFGDRLIEAARQHTGCEKAEVTLSDGNMLFLGEGKNYCLGMMKFLSGKFTVNEPYMTLFSEE